MQSRGAAFFKGMAKKALNAFNPVIGHHFFNLKDISYLLRIDSRKPEEVSKKKGFPAVLTQEALKHVRRNDFENYQDFNLNPFALGACTNYKHLYNGYILGNKGLAEKRWLYGVYGPAVSVNAIRLHVLGEMGNRDYEDEHLILATIPLSSFLFASGPKDRKAFEQGAVVVNDMAQYVPELPATFTVKDVENLPSTLRWLLNNNAHEKAADMAKAVFTGKDSSIVEITLEGDKALAKEVETLISTSQTSKPKS